MKRSKTALAIGFTITALAILISSCRRINEATLLGDDLIPPVDNINTFETNLTVLAFNDTFTLATDSTRLKKNNEQWLGLINADPLFGKTDARMFFELKPLQGTKWVYPFARRDSVKVDSIVLVLSYVETYGDTNVAQTVNVYEMDQSNVFKSDSDYLVRKNDFTYSNLLGSRTFFPRTLKDSVKAFKDTTANQLRIKLDTMFARRLLNYDTLDAYLNDSAFRANFKGFALQSISGRAIMGFNLGSLNTKLAIYYKIPKPGGGDSLVVSYFNFLNNSAAANLVLRDYAGSPVAAAVGGSLPDPFIYIQSTPGTFATLKIPELDTLSNKVVHRAELILEQAFHPEDPLFRPPDLLYLDLFDTTIDKYRSIPFDLQADITGGLNSVSFGMVPRNAVDPFGNPIKVWRFNISRYVQHILNGTQASYDLRISAPFQVSKPFVADVPAFISINTQIAKGRVRFYGNTGPGDLNPQRVRLRIVYSKL